MGFDRGGHLWQPELRRLTGRDRAVSEYLGADPRVGRMLEQLAAFLEEWIPCFAAGGRLVALIVEHFFFRPPVDQVRLPVVVAAFGPENVTITGRHRVRIGPDWDMWLGPAPEAPYTPDGVHFNFRWIWAYSGGIICDWGTHLFDTAQWGNDTERTGPVEIEVDLNHREFHFIGGPFEGEVRLEDDSEMAVTADPPELIREHRPPRQRAAECPQRHPQQQDQGEKFQHGGVQLCPPPQDPRTTSEIGIRGDVTSSPRIIFSRLSSSASAASRVSWRIVVRPGLT